MVRIVLLDVDTVSYGDVDFKEIEALGNVSCANPRDEEEVVEKCKDAEIIIVNKTIMSESIISRLPRLKMIGLFATGYNNIDLDACKKHGVIAVNVPGYSTSAVAQHTMALLLSTVSGLPIYQQSVRDGNWITCGKFSYYASPMEELEGKTFGIFGMGAIGKRVAKLADAFGMKVIFANRSKVENVPYKQVSTEELFRSSDYLSFHCPLNEGTKEIVNKNTLALMKPNAVIINTARGGLVNESDLADALKNRTIRAACLDVVAHEPMLDDNPLYQLPNCFVTPHIAWMPIETRRHLISMVAENIDAFLQGNPIHVVSK